MTILQFNASQRREDERIVAELKLKELQVDKELKLKEFQTSEEIRLKERQTSEEMRLKELQTSEELKLKERQTSEEIRLKQEDYKLKERQAAEEFALKSSQATERNRLSEHRLEEELKQQEKKIEAEIKIKQEEASANIKLLVQKTQTAAAHTVTAEKEVEAATLKTLRLSKQRDVLCDSDRRCVLQRAFSKVVSVLCEVPGCTLYVCAFRCFIAEEPGYTMGDVEKLRVVCIEHCKPPVRVHKVEPDRMKLMTWAYRAGGASHAVCALCGKCDLTLWSADMNVCHVIPVAMGGRSDNDNLVIGSSGCNFQQGAQTLDDYQQRIRKAPIVKTVCVPEHKLEAVIHELQRRDKRTSTKCPLDRMQAILASSNKRVADQKSIRPMLTKRACA
jgi:actin-related protein